jgi:hypothetical protein
MHNANDIRQIEIQTAKPLAFSPSRPKFGIAIAKLKRINLQVVMKLRQTSFQLEVKYLFLFHSVRTFRTIISMTAYQ